MIAMLTGNNAKLLMLIIACRQLISVGLCRSERDWLDDGIVERISTSFLLVDVTSRAFSFWFWVEGMTFEPLGSLRERYVGSLSCRMS